MKIPPILITILPILIVLTLVFTGLLIRDRNHISELTEGGEGATGKTVIALKDEIDKLSSQIHTSEEAITLRKRELLRADLELAKAHYLMVGDKVVAGIATVDQPQIDGKTLSDSQWILTRTLMASVLKDTESLQSEHESSVRQKFDKLDAVVAARQDELQAVLKRITEQDASYREDQDRLNTQVENLGRIKKLRSRKTVTTQVVV